MVSGGSRAGFERRRETFALVAGLLAATASLAVAERSEAAFPPGVNGLIAFSSERDGGDRDIFTMAPDGSGVVNLTSAATGFDAEPAFSPDGGTIAFTSARDGGDLDVFTMPADGSGTAVNLTSDRTATDAEPAFSPDGARIAFSGEVVPGGGRDVFVMGADGSSPVNLTSGVTADDIHPTFSPDGTRIAFVSRRDGGDLDVFVMGADGSNATNLTSADTNIDYFPAFSPDGTQIAFARFVGGSREIVVMPADGGAQTTVSGATPAVDSQPVFSPDGTTIAFVSGAEGTAEDVFTVAADGSGTPLNLTPSAETDDNPDWQRLEPPDTDPPETSIAKGPKKKTNKRKAKFEFAADEPASFQCKLDKGDFEACDPAEKFKVKAKRHRLEVRAVDAAGNVDPTPAEQSWKVKKKK